MDIRKVAGSVSLLLTLILATTPTRADEPQKDPDPANEDSDTPAPPPPPPLRQPKKNATSTRTYSVDQYIPDKRANNSSERLDQMRSNLEQHLKNKALKEFKQHDATLKNNDDREAYYNNECEKYDIDC